MWTWPTEYSPFVIPNTQKRVWSHYIQVRRKLWGAICAVEIRRSTRQRTTSSSSPPAELPSIVARWSTHSVVYASASVGSVGGSYSFPRIMDMRHSFICRRLVSWYKEGVNVDNAILALATYVGHTEATATYWYITGVADLMAFAAQRFQRFTQGASK